MCWCLSKERIQRWVELKTQDTRFSHRDRAERNDHDATPYTGPSIMQMHMYKVSKVTQIGATVTKLNNSALVWASYFPQKN